MSCRENWMVMIVSSSVDRTHFYDFARQSLAHCQRSAARCRVRCRDAGIPVSRKNPSVRWLPILNPKVLAVQEGEVIRRQCCNRRLSGSEYGGLSPACIVKPGTRDG